MTLRSRFIVTHKGCVIVYALYRFRLGEPVAFMTWTGCLN
jgi:hypothetical protein